MRPVVRGEQELELGDEFDRALVHTTGRHGVASREQLDEPLGQALAVPRLDRSHEAGPRQAGDLLMGPVTRFLGEERAEIGRGRVVAPGPAQRFDERALARAGRPPAEHEDLFPGRACQTVAGEALRVSACLFVGDRPRKE